MSTEIDSLVEREIYRVEVEIECENCPDTEEPVCASNGKTFKNICELMCEEAVFLHIGKCIIESMKAENTGHLRLRILNNLHKNVMKATKK